MHRPVQSHAAATAVHTPHPHEAAHLYVSGEATYVDDIPELAGTLHAALGLSQHAHARITSIDFWPCMPRQAWWRCSRPRTSRRTTAATPTTTRFCRRREYVGQPVFAVIAQSYDAARRRP